MAVSKSTWDPFNKTESRYALTNFFCQGQYAERMTKDLGVSEEYKHIQHARELQKEAQDKQQKKIWDSIFKR